MVVKAVSRAEPLLVYYHLKVGYKKWRSTTNQLF